jgi:cytochrome bd ubiquinol oxidase subunit I
LLPAFTVGLASFIAMLEGVHAATQNPIFLRLSQFWLKIFAISFGMGVVAGIVMPFQFGTNWSRYSDAAGNVISPLLAYEGLTAFFLEAAFLGVLIFSASSQCRKNASTIQTMPSSAILRSFLDPT